MVWPTKIKFLRFKYVSIILFLWISYRVGTESQEPYNTILIDLSSFLHINTIFIETLNRCQCSWHHLGQYSINLTIASQSWSSPILTFALFTAFISSILSMCTINVRSKPTLSYCFSALFISLQYHELDLRMLRYIFSAGPTS